MSAKASSAASVKHARPPNGSSEDDGNRGDQRDRVLGSKGAENRFKEPSSFLTVKFYNPKEPDLSGLHHAHCEQNRHQEPAAAEAVGAVTHAHEESARSTVLPASQ